MTSPKFVYDYPRAGLTVDCIIRHNDKVLLIERKFEPFVNHLAIPGGFIDVEYETIEEACKREVKEETNLNVFPRFFCYADRVDRDTRGRTISFIFETVLNDIEVLSIQAGDDAKDFVWIDFDYNTINNQYLAFDHKEILLKFLSSC